LDDLESEQMDEASVTQYITGTFESVDFVVASGDTFFFYNPVSELPPDHRFPFATLVTSDINDRASDLNRPSVFRLNIGVSKDTYRSLFGPQPSRPDADGIVDTGHDFTALDQLLPHPVYAPQSWICVLNPGDATFQAVQRFLAEAYDLAVRRRSRTQPLDES
jgi:hypothetical protein